MGRISRKDLERLSAYLDGELSPEERLIVEAQLASEPQLRSRLEQLRRIRDLLRSLPPVSLRPNFVSETRLRVESEAARHAAEKSAQRSEIIEEEVPLVCAAYINPPEGILSSEYLTSEHLTKENGTEAEQPPKTAQSVGSNYSAVWREIAGRLLRPRTWFWPAVAVGVAILISLLPMGTEQRTSSRQRSVALKADRGLAPQAQIASPEIARPTLPQAEALYPPVDIPHAPPAGASRSLQPGTGLPMPLAERVPKVTQVPLGPETEKGGGESPQGQTAELRSVPESAVGAQAAGPQGELPPPRLRGMTRGEDMFPLHRGETNAADVGLGAPIPRDAEPFASLVVEVSPDLLTEHKGFLIHLASRNGLEVLPAVHEGRDRELEIKARAFFAPPAVPRLAPREPLPPREKQTPAGKVPEKATVDTLAQGQAEILRLWGGEEEIRNFMRELAGQREQLRFREVRVREQLAKTPLGEWLLATLRSAQPLPEELDEGKGPHLAEQTRRTARAGARFNVAPLVPPPDRIMLSPQAELAGSAGLPLASQKVESLMGAEAERKPDHPLPHLPRYLIEIHLVPSSVAPAEEPH